MFCHGSSTRTNSSTIDLIHTSTTTSKPTGHSSKTSHHKDGAGLPHSSSFVFDGNNPTVKWADAVNSSRREREKEKKAFSPYKSLIRNYTLIFLLLMFIAVPVKLSNSTYSDNSSGKHGKRKTTPFRSGGNALNYYLFVKNDVLFLQSNLKLSKLNTSRYYGRMLNNMIRPLPNHTILMYFPHAANKTQNFNFQGFALTENGIYSLNQTPHYHRSIDLKQFAPHKSTLASLLRVTRRLLKTRNYTHFVPESNDSLVFQNITDSLNTDKIIISTKQSKYHLVYYKVNFSKIPYTLAIVYTTRNIDPSSYRRELWHTILRTINNLLRTEPLLINVHSQTRSLNVAKTTRRSKTRLKRDTSARITAGNLSINGSLLYSIPNTESSKSFYQNFPPPTHFADPRLHGFQTKKYVIQNQGDVVSNDRSAAPEHVKTFESLSLRKDTITLICGADGGTGGSHSRAQLMRKTNLNFCEHYPLPLVLGQKGMRNIAGLTMAKSENDPLPKLLRFGRGEEPAGQSAKQNFEKCKTQLKSITRLDSQARKIFQSFRSILYRIDCGLGYSVKWTCFDCEQAYKAWLCSVSIPYYNQQQEQPPCSDFCDEVLQRCPYFLPQVEYGGEPTYLCRNSADIPINRIAPQKTRPQSCYSLKDIFPGKQTSKSTVDRKKRDATFLHYEANKMCQRKRIYAKDYFKH